MCFQLSAQPRKKLGNSVFACVQRCGTLLYRLGAERAAHTDDGFLFRQGFQKPVDGAADLARLRRFPVVRFCLCPDTFRKLDDDGGTLLCVLFFHKIQRKIAADAQCVCTQGNGILRRDRVPERKTGVAVTLFRVG